MDDSWDPFEDPADPVADPAAVTEAEPALEEAVQKSGNVAARSEPEEAAQEEEEQHAESSSLQGAVIDNRLSDNTRQQTADETNLTAPGHEYLEHLKQCLMNPAVLLAQAAKHLKWVASDPACSGLRFGTIAGIWDHMHMRIGRAVDQDKLRTLFRTCVGNPDRDCVGVTHSFQLFYLKMLQSLDPPLLTFETSVDSTAAAKEEEYLELSKRCLIDHQALSQQASKHFGIYAKGLPLIGYKEVEQSWVRIHFRLNRTVDTASVAALADAFSKFCSPYQGTQQLSRSGFELFYWTMLHAMRPHLLQEIANLEEGSTGATQSPRFPDNLHLMFQKCPAQWQNPGATAVPFVPQGSRSTMQSSPACAQPSSVMHLPPAFAQQAWDQGFYSASSLIQYHVGNGRFLIEGTIGKGCYGEVLRAIDVRGHCGRVAIKRMAKRGANIVKECLLPKSLQHPNLIKVLCEFEEAGCLLVVMEFLPGGSLGDRLRRDMCVGGSAEECWAVVVFRQAVSAIAYLHARDVVHNDIKPDNCLLDNPDTALPRVVISDFGQASQATESTASIDKCGDPRYMPPEAWEDSGTWCHAVGSKSADVWMMGCTLFEIFSGGGLPFLSHKHMSLQQFRYQWVAVPEFSANYKKSLQGAEPCWPATNKMGVDKRSDAALDCCASMLMKCPVSRFDCEQVSAHEWLRQGNEETAKSSGARLADEARKRILNEMASTAVDQRIQLGGLAKRPDKISETLPEALPPANPVALPPANSVASTATGELATSQDETDEILPDAIDLAKCQASQATEEKDDQVLLEANNKEAQPINRAQTTTKRLQNKPVRRSLGGDSQNLKEGTPTKGEEKKPAPKTNKIRACDLNNQECSTSQKVPEEVVLELHNITGIDIEHARKLLTVHEGHLENAIRAHLSEVQNTPSPASPSSAPPPPPPPPPAPNASPSPSSSSSSAPHPCRSSSPPAPPPPSAPPPPPPQRPAFYSDAISSEPADTVEMESAAASCPWKKYLQPVSGRTWFFNSDTEEAFFEDEPGLWSSYVTPGSERRWWWHESGEKSWFWDDEADH